LLKIDGYLPQLGALAQSAVHCLSRSWNGNN